MLEADKTGLEEDRAWMRRALRLARRGAVSGEVPVGAILVRAGRPLAEAWNSPIASCDPSAHAEILALRRAAAAVGNYRLVSTTLYVTLEPCPMCAGALVHARVGRLVFGAFDTRAGAASSRFDLLQSPLLNHRVAWRGGVLGGECAALLREFFRRRRAAREQAGPRELPPRAGRFRTLSK
jgi:tRNA(adenine34) deaminase